MRPVAFRDAGRAMLKRVCGLRSCPEGPSPRLSAGWDLTPALSRWERKSERLVVAGFLNRSWILRHVGFADTLSGISPVAPHLIRSRVLLRKVESNVGGWIGDLERRMHEADHVQAAKASWHASELVFLS